MASEPSAAAGEPSVPTRERRASPFGLATPSGLLLAAIAILTALRFVAGAVLPLSFDEAYYWLWSRHLAAGYYDHPPAIAYAIRLGTVVLGATALGVRIVGLLLSVAASWSVWRSAKLLGAGEYAALSACLFFNLTLMVAVETMAATPDAMALAGAAFLLLALCELHLRGDGRWWLIVGAAGGFCLLSKYTGFFLGAGIALWLVATKDGWRWIKTPWPYVGGAVALALFAPVIAWNAAHGWMSFKFQFGRTATGGFTFRYFGEFLLGQLVLASPFLLALAAAGFVRASRWGRAAVPVTLPAALMWPALVYFAVHATHDRVQGNWPSFLYPALAVLAAYAGAERWRGRIAMRIVAVCRLLAVPVAALIVILVYAQALFGAVAMRDPVARLTAMGFPRVAAQVEAIAHRAGARAILTASYATTAWFAFYLHPAMPVIQANEEFRWLSSPLAAPGLARTPLVFVTLHDRSAAQVILARFANVEHVAEIDRRAHHARIETYDVYLLSGWRGGSLGREP